MNSNERVVGNLNLSISTNLAIDGLYNRIPDKAKEIPMPATLGNAAYFNVRTLFRNIWTSMKSEDAENTSRETYVDLIEQEMVTIKSALEEESHPLAAFFYAPSYEHLQRFYPNGELKSIKTEKMSFKATMENLVLARLKEEELQVDIDFNDVELKTDTPYKAFILSHYPVDLLHTKGFDKVYLLESHTGIVKGPDKWYTKLAAKNLENIDRIPFNKGTIQFYGDSGGMFKAQPMGARKRMIEVAVKYKWNQHTKRERMLATLQLSGEGAIEQTLRKLW